MLRAHTLTPWQTQGAVLAVDDGWSRRRLIVQIFRTTIAVRRLSALSVAAHMRRGAAACRRTCSSAWAAHALGRCCAQASGRRPVLQVGRHLDSGPVIGHDTNVVVRYLARRAGPSLQQRPRYRRADRERPIAWPRSASAGAARCPLPRWSPGRYSWTRLSRD